MTSYPLLFAPLRVGAVTLRNRVVNLPQGMGYTNRGLVEDEDVAYHRRRAIGGVGLVITGGTATDPASQDRTRNFIAAYDPAVVPGLRRRADAVHDAGAHIVGQIFNLGRYMAADAMTVPPLAPSPVRAPGLRYAPMAMGRAEIDDIVAAFVVSAKHLREAGCDGVEIHAAHGYLLAQFLSAATNRRDDEYGGSADGRRRLLIEVADAVRSACGPDFVVGVRMSADDEWPAGTTVDECHEHAAGLLDRVAIDYLSLAVGLRGTYVKDSSEPEGAALDRIAAVKADLPVPVVASQRIRHPELAERALRAGQADLVGMARALIADPDWAVKAARGEAGRIRLCVGAVQDCRSHLVGGLRCMVNADVSNEVAAARSADARVAGSVAVIGAGPAGLEVARRAAARGMRVTVYEAAESPGGQVRLAAGMAGRSELLDHITYLTGESRALGVTVHYGQRLDLESAAALTSDHIVVATGATGAPIAGDGVTVWDVLTTTPTAERVVIVDDGLGDWSTLTAAWRLAEQGSAVTIATPAGSAVTGVPGESQAGVRARLRAAGVTWLLDVTVKSTSDDGVGLERLGTGETIELPADLVVTATGRQPVDTLWRELRERRPGVLAVGDVLTPRTIGNAIRDTVRVVDLISAAEPVVAP